MAKNSLKWIALLGGVTLGAASFAVAQDSGALLDALVKKGVLNDQEAEEIRADLTRDNAAALPKFVAPGGRNTTKLAFSGRIQAQYIGLDTDVSGAADPAAINHFLLRRVYLGARAEFGPDWMGQVTYDFAGDFFDAAFVQYKGLDSHTIDFGLRKVNFGYEERSSSASLKGIERSGVTRYFAEDNNGRRIGAASYRVGLYIDGTQGNFFYGAAITNPERPAAAGGSSSVGTASNNNLAYWANAGLKGKIGENGKHTTGVGIGYLPDQGGLAVGTGNDLLVASLYTDLTFGKLNILAEALWSDNEGGAVGGADANSWGYYIQPAFKLTEQWELVARYSYLDTDGRGVRLSDGVRSAAAPGVNFDTLHDYYLGFNYYFKGNDVKFSAGFVYGKSDDRIPAAGATSAEVTGIRTQMQVNF